MGVLMAFAVTSFGVMTAIIHHFALPHVLFDTFSGAVPGTFELALFSEAVADHSFRKEGGFCNMKKVLTTFALGRTIVRPNDNIFALREALLFPFFQLDVQHAIQTMCMKDVVIFFPEDALQPT